MRAIESGSEHLHFEREQSCVLQREVLPPHVRPLHGEASARATGATLRSTRGQAPNSDRLATGCRLDGLGSWCAKRRASYAPGAVMQACVTPCMANLNNRCCMVPKKIASLFPCCREARPAFPLPHNASPRFIAAAGSGPPIGPPIVLAEFRAFYR